MLDLWAAVILTWSCIQKILFTPFIKSENHCENCRSNPQIIIGHQDGNSKSVINPQKYYADNINKYFYSEKQIETLNKKVGKLEDDHHENISKIIMESKPQNYCQQEAIQILRRKMRILGNENKYYQQHKLHGEIIRLENEKRNYQHRQHHQKEELEQLQRKIALQQKQIIRLENENENDQKRQRHQKEELEQLRGQIIRLENENENYQKRQHHHKEELEQSWEKIALQQRQIIRLENRNENENYQNHQHHQKEQLEQLQKKIALLNKHLKCFQAKKKDVVTTQALEKILQQNQLLPQTFEEKK